MNIVNIKAAIRGMKWVLKKEIELKGRLTWMPVYQSRVSENHARCLFDGELPAKKRTELIAGGECGTAACFVGHMSLMPHFQKLGLKTTSEGSPFLIFYEHHLHADEAVARLLDIPAKTASQLCCMGFDVRLYGKPIRDITTKDVIEQLEKLLEIQS